MCLDGGVANPQAAITSCRITSAPSSSTRRRPEPGRSPFECSPVLRRIASLDVDPVGLPIPGGGRPPATIPPVVLSVGDASRDDIARQPTALTWLVAIHPVAQPAPRALAVVSTEPCRAELADGVNRSRQQMCSGLSALRSAHISCLPQWTPPARHDEPISINTKRPEPGLTPQEQSP